MPGRKGKGGKSPVHHDGLFQTFLTHTDTARNFLVLHLPTGLVRPDHPAAGVRLLY